jgi:hypothetical protein
LQFPVTFYWHPWEDTCAQDEFLMMFLFQRHYYRPSHVSMPCPALSVFVVVIGEFTCKASGAWYLSYFCAVTKIRS